MRAWQATILPLVMAADFINIITSLLLFITSVVQAKHQYK
jgi:hypothetical protein